MKNTLTVSRLLSRANKGIVWKALFVSTKPSHICTLGYKLKEEVIIVATMPTPKPKPIEECPKPKTYS